MTEAELQTAVQQELTGRRIWFLHLPRQLGRKRRQVSDLPDLTCIGYGCCFFIELKSKTGKLSAGQIEFIHCATANGVPVLVADNPAMVTAFLNGLQARRKLTARS